MKICVNNTYYWHKI